ncbi:ABC transporter permease [Pseudomonadales bacterium]|nr:ABC transporter permease [Pseudomonadales bacterium]MDA8952150.1 ABC transporter permease [Pseudomonadales bacterium]MDB0050729.1 ABC transporter permease [Pseudomonadales bacterium]
MSHPFSNLTVFIAMRYAWGSGVMSYVSKLALAGLVLSITVLVLVISVVNGFDRELRDRVLALLPHVSISSDQGIPADHPLMLTELPAASGLESLAPYIQSTGLVAANGRIQPVEMTGVEASSYNRVSRVEDYLHGGTLAGLEEKNFTIIIGATLARQLEVGIGDDLVLMLPNAQLSIAGAIARQRRFEIVDVFESQSQLDGSGVFVSLRSAQLLLRMRGEIHGFQGRLTDLFAIYDARQFLQQAVAMERLTVRTWMSTHGNLYQAVAVQKVTMFILFSFLVAVAAFNLVSGLMMMVEQRKSDIAVLKSMGADNRSLLKVFCCLGLLLGGGGTLLGLALGVSLALFLPWLYAQFAGGFGLDLMSQYFIYYLPVDVQVADLLTVGAISTVLTLLASLYPALQATRLLPSRILANE